MFIQNIGGNKVAALQVFTSEKDAIGSGVKTWHDVCSLTGWLDYSSGEAKNAAFLAKVEESTHMFLCDYQTIPDVISIHGKDVKVKEEDARMVIDNKVYDVLLIDDPMQLHYQLEVYLKYTGGL